MKANIESLPVSVSASEIARRNQQYWNTPRVVQPSPAAPAPAASYEENLIADELSPMGRLPMTVSQKESVAACLRRGDGVTRQ